MRAVRVHEFGGPEKLLVEEIERPSTTAGQVLVEVHAAGVGPWDAWIRSGQSALPQPLPLTPGSDISGVVVRGAAGFAAGQAVFGMTNSQFTGGYAEYAAATSMMLAAKPEQLSHVEAASIPVVAVTANQMLFKHAALTPGQRVLVQGAAGSVGSYAVQLAKIADLEVFPCTYPGTFNLQLKGSMDAVLDLVGGTHQSLLFDYLRPGGTLVSAVSEPDQRLAQARSVRAKFFLVEVNTRELEQLGELIQTGRMRTHVGAVLPLDQARLAHEMLDRVRPKRDGKIVLRLTG